MEMKNRIVTYSVAAVMSAVVVLTIFYPEQMISPGNPIESHSEIADDCFACHTPFFGSRSSKCIACHKVDEIGIVTTKGLSIEKEEKNIAFHQQLIEEDCMACHSDHRGVQAFRPIDQFSHQLIKPTMIEECDSCHANPTDALHQKIVGSCNSCHVINHWSPATFDHKKYFRFDRDHTTDCDTCHINNDYNRYTCYGCHEHSRSKIREEHVEEGIRDYEVCVECHRSGDEHEAERIWRSKRDKSGKYRHHHDEEDDD
jgi:hypothetical protein